MTLDPLTISVGECARILGISVRMVRYYIAKKQLVSRVYGNRRVVVFSSARSFSRKDHPVVSPPRKEK
jgi:DNA-binding transcriptional MerR regulator